MSTEQIELERMTWPEVRAALDAGCTTVVVSVGAVEQHGPHLPLFMDAEHGTALALGTARALGNALVAPTIRIGCSEHHMKFPGTISVEPETLEAVLRDYARSLARHGFTKLCVIPSHGGNFAPLAAMQARVQQAVGDELRVVIYGDLHNVITTWRRATEEVAGLGSRVGGHADIAESSVMMALHPELVRVDRAEEGFAFPLTDDMLRRLFRDGIGALAPNGILGDARGLSAAIGRRCIDEFVAALAGYFRSA